MINNDIGETKRNVEVRWNEPIPTKSSEPSKHFRKNIDHSFALNVISDAPKMLRPGRI